MKIAGIIAEYNPFHSGHQYHIEETRKACGADYIIVLMSGDFVQRGEPAILDKYSRCRMALKGGADVVIEMPAYYATASAEYFATAGIGILDALNCVDCFSFGSEWADIKELTEVADLLLEESPDYQRKLKESLSQGKNYPRAREEALRFCLRNPELADLLKTPNHILGVEYLKAHKRRKSRMQPWTIRRKGSGYHEDNIWARESYPSATAIRNYLNSNIGSESGTSMLPPSGELSELLEKAIPQEANLLLQKMSQGDFVSWKDLMPFLDYAILMGQDPVAQARLYFGQDEEMLRRMKKCYQPGQSMDEIIARCHSKNYTDAALRRLFLHILLQMEEKDFLKTAVGIPIPYARILGFRKESSELLAHMRKCSQIPIIQKVSMGQKLWKEDAIARQIYRMDLRSANFYEQIAAAKSGRKMIHEMTRNQIIL